MTANQWLFAIGAVAIALAAACVLVAIGFARYSKRISGPFVTTSTWKTSERKLDAALEQLDELREAVGTLSSRYENLRSRVGMRETRAARDAPRAPVESTAEWKERMRKQLGVGGIAKPQPTGE